MLSSEIGIKIQQISLKKGMKSAKMHPFSSGLNVLLFLHIFISVIIVELSTISDITVMVSATVYCAGQWNRPLMLMANPDNGTHWSPNIKHSEPANNKETNGLPTSLWHCSFNSLWPSDAIWRHRSGSTLVQGWLFISKVLWHSSEDIIIRRFEDTNQ